MQINTPKLQRSFQVEQLDKSAKAAAAAKAVLLAIRAQLEEMPDVQSLVRIDHGQ